MSIAILATAIALTGVVVLAARTGQHDSRPVPIPRSPLDEAERILARRYARGEITFEEFERMMALLRT